MKKTEEWWEAYIFNEWMCVLDYDQLELLIENIKFIISTNERRKKNNQPDDMG